MLVFQQMMILFLIMLIGYICYHMGLIDDEANSKLSGLVIYVANPALILSATMGSGEKVQGAELALAMGISFGVYAWLILVSYLVPLILRVKKQSAGVYRVMTIFSNIGFIGFPIIIAVYGEGALIYATLFVIPYNLLIYTYGINTMKPPDQVKEKPKLSRVFNIGVIACLITMALYLLDLPIPLIISSTSKLLGNLAAPLCMLVIGASLATVNLKSLFTDVRLLAFMVLKQILIPVAGALLLSLFIKNPTLIGVSAVILSTPVGSMTAMLAQQYGGDFELSTRGVSLSTLLSVVTIPLVIAIVAFFQ